MIGESKQLWWRNVGLVLIGLSLASCAALDRVKESVHKPTARVVDTRLASISFDGAELLFDVELNNPNRFGLSMDGFDYRLMIGQRSLVSGQSSQGLKIAKRGSSRVAVPVAVAFKDLRRISNDLEGQNEIPYRIEMGFGFDLKVLGRQRIPLAVEGRLPIPRLPKLSLDGLKIKGLNLSGADLELGIGIDNPNSFGLDLGRLNFGLDINGSRWAAGQVASAGKVAAGQKQSIKIPMRVDLVNIGRDAYRILVDKKPLDYQFSGAVDLGTTHKLLKSFNWPIDLKGSLTPN